MPRKKTVQPEPLETIVCDDFIIEIRDRETQLIGRGMANHFEGKETVFKILDIVMDYYLSNDPKKRDKAIAWLEGERTGGEFKTFLQLRPELNLDERILDERTFWRHIKRARHEWQTLKAALDQHNESKEP